MIYYKQNKGDSEEIPSKTSQKGNKMKIKNLRKAVSYYKECNAGGRYDSRYGILMLDRASGELWVDEYSDFGRNSFTAYNNPALCNLSRRMEMAEININESSVRMFAEKLCEQWTGAAAEF